MDLTPVAFEPARSYEEALRRAAEICGVQLEYWDIWGRRHEATPQVVRAILESLGIAAGSLEELNRALEERWWGYWSSAVDPVVVLDEGGPWQVDIRVPALVENGRVRVRILEATGRMHEWVQALGELETIQLVQARGRLFEAKRLLLPKLEIGYHRLEISMDAPGVGEITARTELIVGPEQAYLPPDLAAGKRYAGLTVPLYALRSHRNWGVGDFTDLQKLVDWAVDRAGCQFIGLNPLHAIFNRRPFNTSPYLPASVFYRNFIYIDVDRVEDWIHSRWAVRLRFSDGFSRLLEELRAQPFVEYERVARVKRAFLKLAFRAFLRHWRENTPRAREFRAYIQAEGERLDRFAVFCALEEWHHRRNPEIWVWQQWPAEYHDPASPAVEEFARRHWRSVLFHKYVQWQLEQQLRAVQDYARARGMTLGLFHDLALTVDRCGADFWAYRHLFAEGCRVGAPPDDFSPKGQDWSFPPPSAEALRRDAYRYVRDSIRRCCQSGGILRIDHVMRFFRLFWIPDGCDPNHGTYVHYPYGELLRVVALESVLHRVVIVGEDLGTVEPWIRQQLAKARILGYRVFYFERDEQGRYRRPDEYPVSALVSSTTHDLPTLAGFWQARDIEARRQASLFPNEELYHRAVKERERDKQAILDALDREGLLPNWVPRSAAELPELTGDLHNAIVGFLARTPCLLLNLNQEDLTKETEQQNLPGTTAEYPNWMRKMRYTIEELESSPEVEDFLRMWRRWLAETGRLPVAQAPQARS